MRQRHTELITMLHMLLYHDNEWS